MRLFHASLAAHRATGLPDERWRVQFTFLGVNVCRDAFLVLTGVGSSVLQSVRADVLNNKASYSTAAERGLHGALLRNTSKNMAYLSARQWLEAYAESHSEWSPMDAKAYLPAGRKVFFYYHYRRDMLERHGLTDDGVALGRAPRLAKRRRDGGLCSTGTGVPTTSGAGAYAPAPCRVADIPLADPVTFFASVADRVPMAHRLQEREHVHAVQCVRVFEIAH